MNSFSRSPVTASPASPPAGLERSHAAAVRWATLMMPLLVSALLLVGCKSESGPQADAGEKADGPGIPVETAHLERGDVFAVHTGTASLETDADALVVAKVGGEIVEILVEEGDSVRTGDVVGEVGSSGRSTGPHLHYEVRRDGAAVDPLRFLKAGRKIAGLL